VTDAAIIGCILAGGRSERMGGGDKCLQGLSGRPLLGHVIERFGPQVDSLILNANGDPARFAAFGLTVVADPIDGFVGPLAGILAGLLWARAQVPDARFVVTVAGDTPFVPEDLVARFLTATRGRADAVAIAASNGRVHPVFGLWPLALADDLQDWLSRGQSRKVRDWVARHDPVEVTIADTVVNGRAVDPFFNINRPEDMDTASAVLGGPSQ